MSSRAPGRAWWIGRCAGADLAGCFAGGGMDHRFAGLQSARVADKEEALAIWGNARASLSVAGVAGVSVGKGPKRRPKEPPATAFICGRTRGCGWGDTGRSVVRLKAATLTLSLREQLQQAYGGQSAQSKLIKAYQNTSRPGPNTFFANFLHCSDGTPPVGTRRRLAISPGRGLLYDPLKHDSTGG